MLNGEVDPMTEIVKFSKEYNLSDENLPKKSCGKGQEDYIERGIIRAREKGQWIIIQNCHMCPTIMPILENRLIETCTIMKANENRKKKKDDEEDEEDEEQRIRIDPKFRFWITTQTTTHFST